MNGCSYGEVFTQPRLLRVEPDGNFTTVATGENNGPWDGVAFARGAFWVSEGGSMEGGRLHGDTRYASMPYPSCGGCQTSGFSNVQNIEHFISSRTSTSGRTPPAGASSNTSRLPLLLHESYSRGLRS